MSLLFPFGKRPAALSLASEALDLTRAGRLRDVTTLVRDAIVDGGRHRDSPAAPRRETPVDRPDDAAAVAGETPFGWHRVSDAAGSRRYKLFVPTMPIVAPRPLLLMLHGCTQSPDDFAAGTRMNEVAAEHGVLVAYPEQTRAHNSAKCWNWFKPGQQRRGGGEVALLAAIVDDVAKAHAIDRRRVFVAGLSAGGAAAASLAYAYPDLFAAVGVHSGLACGAAHDLQSAFAAMRDGAPARGNAATPVPTIVFHGGADRTVAPVNARHVLAGVIAGLASSGAVEAVAPGGAAYTREVWRDGRGRACAEDWRIAGAGHAWSGGSPAGSYTDPRGPDASRAMMRFFLALRD